MSVLDLARPDLRDRPEYSAVCAVAEPAVRLHCNENPWPPPGTGDPLINRYPEKQPALLVGQMAELCGVGPHNLLVTRGADDAIDAVIRGFCPPGKSAIAHCPPTFVMYDFFGRLHGANVMSVPLLRDHGFAVDFSGLRQAAATGARILFLCSPNNPTGTVIPDAPIRQLAGELERQAIVVVDEAYIEFTGQGGLAAAVARHPNLVVLRTLSKAWSLAGARLGALIGDPELVDYLARAAITPYPLPRSSITAALAALRKENRPMAEARVQELVDCREPLRTALESFSFVHRVYPSEANFLLVHVDDAGRVVQCCADRGILVRDQSGQPGLENHIRISVGTAHENTQLLAALRESGAGS